VDVGVRCFVFQLQDKSACDVILLETNRSEW
jgi:hypothetical protein